MRDLWQRLEAFLKKHAPAALDALNPPATEEEIRDAQSELGVRFPADFVASLCVHNGCAQLGDVGLIPQEYEQRGIYKATFGDLAPLSLVVEKTQFYRETIAENWAKGADDYEYEGPVRRDGDWSWITFVDSGSGDTLGLDLRPDEGGQIGQVLSILHDPACLLVLAPSYRDWFQALVTRYESGRYFFEDENGELEAVDRFRSNGLDRADNDDDADDGNILRFPG